MTELKIAKFDFTGFGLELLQQICKIVMSACALFLLVSPEEIKSLDCRLITLGVILVIIWSRK